MKPISQIVSDDNCTVQANNPTNSKALDESDLAEIEQIVKEKMVSYLTLWEIYYFEIIIQFT